MNRYRVFESFNHGAGDPARWIAAVDEEGAAAAARRLGWSRPSEITPLPHPAGSQGPAADGVRRHREEAVVSETFEGALVKSISIENMLQQRAAIMDRVRQAIAILKEAEQDHRRLGHRKP